MTSNKCAMYYGAKDIRIENKPLSKPGAGEVKIKVAWCGICGTDLHEYESGPILCPTTEKAHPVTGEKLPICLGHEFSGTIVEVGSDLKKGYKVGDRVVVEPVISCSKCYACDNDFSNACSDLGWVGLSGFGGGLAEFLNAKEEYLHHLPDNVSFESGAMVEPLAVAMHAVEMSGMKKGDTALVLGAGPIGCFTVKALIAQGASKVICSEPSASRRKMASLAGAHHVFSPKDNDVVAESIRLSGNGSGVDVAFDCAGVQATINAALAALRTRGTCVNVAIWSTKPQIDMNVLVLGEKTLKGVICYRYNHAPAIELLSSGKIQLEEFITAKVNLEDVVEKGFHELINNNEVHVKILVTADPRQ